ncbi:cyclic nucleotide-gated ion channel 15 [Olea europaea subsp. europaea]|uniref:Cyclic nucleotide-gated ion channel 15 n=1 Tax=Olea europaea subsp. europaea TaxID=158383 RepID=A0A8S0V2G5_OLEEU|nr:cyclic nucleotide-gated ion channel 15 [Olea europaea subsp. europaea]
MDSRPTSKCYSPFFNSYCRSHMRSRGFCSQSRRLKVCCITVSKTTQQKTKAQVKILLSPVADAAYFIQATWRRYKKRKSAAELRELENLVTDMESSKGKMDENAPPGSGFAIYVARLAASRRGLHKHSGSDSRQ